MNLRCLFGHDAEHDRRHNRLRCLRCGRVTTGFMHEASAQIAETQSRQIYAQPDGREKLPARPAFKVWSRRRVS